MTKKLRCVHAGLDSASTFTIVQSLANWAHATDATIVVALLQPEPQVYDLFDDVMLLSNGRIVYHGPRPHAEPYFEALGFWSWSSIWRVIKSATGSS